jgi:hypothetical protein
VISCLDIRTWQDFGLDQEVITAAIQSSETYLMDNYINEGTFQGGWYFDNDIANGLLGRY